MKRLHEKSHGASPSAVEFRPRESDRARALALLRPEEKRDSKHDKT